MTDPAYYDVDPTDADADLWDPAPEGVPTAFETETDPEIPF